MDERREAVLGQAEVQAIRNEIAASAALPEAGGVREMRELCIAARLSRQFSLKDLSDGAVVVTDPGAPIHVAVQVDPAFSARQRAMLLEAARLYFSHAVDADVIGQAMRTSVDHPTPRPERPADLRAVSPDDPYLLYLDSTARPRDGATFRRHLLDAYNGPHGAPALLVISKYTGGKWWGAGYYHHYYAPEQRLSKRQPSDGYLYIRLNADRMVEGAHGWNDPRFWAPKVGHEILHNLGYWHPAYEDPVHRDEHNVGRTRAFVPAYEVALHARIHCPNR